MDHGWIWNLFSFCSCETSMNWDQYQHTHVIQHSQFLDLNVGNATHIVNEIRMCFVRIFWKGSALNQAIRTNVLFRIIVMLCHPHRMYRSNNLNEWLCSCMLNIYAMSFTLYTARCRLWQSELKITFGNFWLNFRQSISVTLQIGYTKSCYSSTKCSKVFLLLFTQQFNVNQLNCWTSAAIC